MARHHAHRRENGAFPRRVSGHCRQGVSPVGDGGGVPGEGVEGDGSLRAQVGVIQLELNADHAHVVRGGCGDRDGAGDRAIRRRGGGGDRRRGGGWGGRGGEKPGGGGRGNGGGGVWVESERGGGGER